MEAVDFMTGQITSLPALNKLRRVWSLPPTSTLFLGPHRSTLNDSYAVGLRAVQRDSTLELQVTRPPRSNLELDVTLFGRISPSAITAPSGPPRGRGSAVETVAKRCFIYDGQLYDMFDVGMPTNASQSMVEAYGHQLQQINNILTLVAVSAEVPVPLFPVQEETVTGNNIDFHIIGPPTFKIGDSESLDQMVFTNAAAITVDTDPRFPRDEIYDLHQIRRQNWSAFQHLNNNTVAIFRGKFKCWAVEQMELQWRFFAESISVIAQGAEPENVLSLEDV